MIAAAAPEVFNRSTLQNFSETVIRMDNSIETDSEIEIENDRRRSNSLAEKSNAVTTADDIASQCCPVINSANNLPEISFERTAECGPAGVCGSTDSTGTQQCAAITGGRDAERLQSQHQHAVLVFNLRCCLAEQDRLIRRLRAEKDEQLMRISSGLLLLESKLRRDRIQVESLLKEKELKIMEQDTCIRALLRLNRKLAAGRHRRLAQSPAECDRPGRVAQKRQQQHHTINIKQQRRISWNSKVSILSEDGRRWHASYRETNGRDRFPNLREVSDDGGAARENKSDEDAASSTSSQVETCVIRKEEEEEEEEVDEEEEEEEEEVDELARAADEACDAFHEVLDGYVSDDPTTKLLDSPRPFIFQLGHGHLTGGPLPGGGVFRGGLGCRGRAPNLGIVYNRVMSNHRSVTKPKDVKYKKISRVKSRSLEELRGRLRNFAQPMLRRVGQHVDEDGDVT